MSSKHWKKVENKVCKDWQEAAEKSQKVLEKGNKVVFTNGCFDLLHPGHLQYLSEARDCGDMLIVGLNDDTSVRRLKGEGRPIREVWERALMLAALQMVDAVVVFGEDTPLELIKYLQPDVLVKGGDYTLENIVGAREVLESNGTVKQLSFVEGYSTTSLIRKIKKL